MHNYTLKALTLFTTLSLLFVPTTGSALVGHEADPGPIATTGYLIYDFYRLNPRINRLHSALERELGAIERAVTDLENNASAKEGQASTLDSEAKLVRAGKPNLNSESIYTGKFAQYQYYQSQAGVSSAMRSSAYRLQVNDARVIAERILADPRTANGQFEVVLHRVGGTMNGSITPSSSIRIGPDNLVNDMVAAAKNQSSTQAQNSIVRVDLKYKTFDAPNPSAAGKLEARAQELRQEARGIKEKAEAKRVSPEHTRRIKAAQAKYSQILRRLKTIRRAGIAGMSVAWLWSFTAVSLAQEMITIAKACDDEYARDRKALGLSLELGIDQAEADDEILNLCGQ